MHYKTLTGLFQDRSSVLIKLINALLFIGIYAGSSACTITQKIPVQASLRRSPCNHLKNYQYTKSDLPVPFHEVQLDTALIQHFSNSSLQIANAIDVLPQLEQYFISVKNYRRSPDSQNQLTMLHASDKLRSKLNVATLQIDAVVSELDCEEERTDQVADYLHTKTNNLETRLTVAAIATGAATAIMSGILITGRNRDPDTAEIIGITGGVTEALLGASILLVGRRVEFIHPRNMLRDIWEGTETSPHFPPSIWYYLHYQDPAKPDQPSLRNRIIDTWTQFGQIEDLPRNKVGKARNLYFGNGGIYTAEQLTNRANMHDQLEAHISLMRQDLMQLSLEIDALTY